MSTRKRRVFKYRLLEQPWEKSWQTYVRASTICVFWQNANKITYKVDMEQPEMHFQKICDVL